MIPLVSAMRLHSSLFRNAGAPSCHFFSSIRPSVVSLGPGGHKLYCRNLLAGEIQKSFNNAGTILFYLMGRGGSSWSSRVGSYHGLKVKCTRASSEESKALQKFALCLALTAMFIKAQLSLEPASASHFVAAIPDVSILMSGSPVTDPNALLRYALPIDNKPIRDIQKNLENITGNLKVPDVKALKSAKKNIEEATLVLNQSKPEILAEIAESKKENGRELVDTLILGLQDFQKIVEAGDRDALASKQKELLNIIGHVEEDMVDEFPFDVPEDYSSKPLLKGRATLEMKVKVKDNPNIDDVVFQLVLDGYNAPVTAGNFVDLVERHFYDGMEIQRADGLVVQTGDPEGPAEGFVDPSTGKIRTIPLEIMVRGDRAPIYGATLEECGRYNAQTKLPFNAFGTMAMARNEFEDNSASSQVFWLLKERKLTPSSSNILDGRYAVFGYVTENQNYLADLKVGDVIESIRVVSGIDNLVNPSYKIVG